MASQIHPSAIVDPEAQLGEGVEIGPFVVITQWARLGDGVKVHPGAVVGGDPQYTGFDATLATYAEVGAGTVIRESVTINRSMYAGKATRVGARCMLMACSHVGHDSAVADEVVLANNVMLAGHVEVGAKTFVGGGAGIHQFCRLGEGVMIAGLARITKDVPPFCMAAERDDLTGLNLVGLKRREWPREIIGEIKSAYHAVLSEAGNPKPRAAAFVADARSDAARTFLEFFAGGKRPIARARSAEGK